MGALAGLLRAGGAGTIQLPIAARPSLGVLNTLMKVPLTSNVLDVVRGRRWSHPHMQMNVCDLSRLVLILHDHGIDPVHACPAPPAADFRSCARYFRR